MQNMVKNCAIMMGCLTLPSVTMASDFELTLGGYYWHQNYSGDFRVETDFRPIDAEDDLGFDTDQNGVAYLYLDTGIGALPKFKIQHTVIESEEQEFVVLQFEFNGTVFNIMENIRSEIQFDHTDITAFYDIVEGSNNQFGIGLTARKFDGEASIVALDGGFGASSIDFDDTIPMLYTRYLWTSGGWRIGGELQGASYQDNTIFDANAHIQYRFDSGVGLGLGYRHADLDIEDFGGIEADITTSGAFFGLDFTF